MAPKFQVKAFNSLKIIKNISIITIVVISFLLVLFSKSDYYLIGGIKNISSNIITPISKIISSPIYLISNFKSEYKQFRSLKFENRILQEEIMRLKKWQTLAIQNSRENKVLKKTLKCNRQ